MAGQKKLVDGSMCGLSTRLTELGQGLRGSQDRLQLVEARSGMAEKQLEDLRLLLQERVQASELQKLRSVVNGIQLHLNYVEQYVQHETGTLQERTEQLEAACAGAERQMEDIQLLLQDRVRASEMAQVRGGIDGLTTHVALLEAAVEERARASQVNQFNSVVLDLEKQLAEARRGLQEKAGLALAQELGAGLARLEQQVAAVELLGREITAAAEEAQQQLNRGLSATSLKLAALQETVHHKADSHSLEALASGLEALQAQAPNTEEEVQACMERTHALEGSPAALSEQLAQAEELLRSKVDALQVQHMDVGPRSPSTASCLLLLRSNWR